MENGHHNHAQTPNSRTAHFQLPSVDEEDENQQQQQKPLAAAGDEASSGNLRLFCMTFKRDNKINMIDADQYVVHIVRHMIVTFWPDGLRRDGPQTPDCWQLQFYGSPFAPSTSKEDATNIRRLCSSWLSGLQKAGWTLVASADLTGGNDLTTWIFANNKSSETITNPQLVECSQVDTSIVCVSISKKDKLQMLNGPDSLHDEMQAAVGPYWLQDAQIDHKDSFRFRSSFVVKIYGNPWQSNNTQEIIKGRRILLNLFRRFHYRRCLYYGSVDVKGTADCLFFHEINEPDSVPYSNYAMMSLNFDDRLILIDLPAEVQLKLHRHINGSWPGVRSVVPHSSEHSCQEFHLNKRPWNCDGDNQARARLLLAQIFDLLSDCGWMVHCSLDLSRLKDDTAALVLRCELDSRGETIVSKAKKYRHICLAPCEPNTLWLLGCPVDTRDRLNAKVQQIWAPGVIKSVEKDFGFEWVLRGDPWQAKKGKMDGRRLVLSLMSMLLNDGWRCVCAADVSSKCDINSPRHESGRVPSDIHALYFVKSMESTSIGDSCDVNTNLLDLLGP